MATTAQGKAAKEYTTRFEGLTGHGGGWIYSGSKTVCQGWSAVYSIYATKVNDYLTRKLTAFASFADLVNAGGAYRPTLLTGGRGGWRYEALADAYDAAQRRAGSPKRAYRG